MEDPIRKPLAALALAAVLLGIRIGSNIRNPHSTIAFENSSDEPPKLVLLLRRTVSYLGSQPNLRVLSQTCSNISNGNPL